MTDLASIFDRLLWATDGQSRQLVPGDVVKYGDGRQHLVGHVNKMGGTCDDCLETAPIVAVANVAEYVATLTAERDAAIAANADLIGVHEEGMRMALSNKDQRIAELAAERDALKMTYEEDSEVLGERFARMEAQIEALKGEEWIGTVAEQHMLGVYLFNAIRDAFRAHVKR